MSQGLIECRETVKRVNGKIGNLKRSIDRYHSNSCRIVAEDNLEKAERIYRLVDVNQPPLGIAMQVTEITCLMRAALDHLMFLLVSQARGTPLPDNEFSPYFPICSTEAKFDKAGTDLQKNYGLSQDVIDWLKRIQAFHAPDPKNRVLYQLTSIVGIAKHRFHNVMEVAAGNTIGKLHGIGGLSATSTVVDNTFNGIRVTAFEILGGDFKEGAPIARVALGRNAGGGLVLGRGASMTLGGTGASFATSNSAGPVSQEFMDAAIDQLKIDLKPSQHMRFGPGSGVAEGIEVVSLLKTINGFLQKEILGKNNVTATL